MEGDEKYALGCWWPYCYWWNFIISQKSALILFNSVFNKQTITTLS